MHVCVCVCVCVCECVRERERERERESMDVCMDVCDRGDRGKGEGKIVHGSKSISGGIFEGVKGCDTGVKQVCIWRVFVGRAHVQYRWVVAREHVHSMCKEIGQAH